MDGLKKNLHFVVFGVGILLGVIFLFVGMSMRGGKEAALDDAMAQLNAGGAPPSRGDVEAAEQKRKQFDTSLSDAEAALKSQGRALLKDFDPGMSGSNFFSDVARPALGSLQQRFDEMRVETTLPDPLGKYGYIYAGRRDNDVDKFWQRQETDMASPTQEQIRGFWIQLRIMDEVATICEELLAAGAGDGKGVDLKSFQFEQETRVGSREEMSPWTVAPWTVMIECSPSFSILLLSELTAPSQLGGEARRRFPNQLVSYQTQLKGRPHKAAFTITNEYKKELEQPEDLDPESFPGKDVINRVKKNLEEEVAIADSVSVGLKLHAAIYNDAWRPMVEPVEQ